MRRHRALALGAAVVVGALGVAPAAEAAGPQTGGCPPGFTLWRTSDIPGYGSFYGYQSADLNQDQKTCVRLLSSRTELVFMDNVLPSSDA